MSNKLKDEKRRNVKNLDWDPNWDGEGVHWRFYGRVGGWMDGWMWVWRGDGEGVVMGGQCRLIEIGEREDVKVVGVLDERYIRVICQQKPFSP